MDLTEASHMVLMESAPHADLLNVAQAVHEDFAAGLEVPSVALTGMLYEASRKGVLRKLEERHGDAVLNEMITVLAREANRMRSFSEAPRSRPGR